MKLTAEDKDMINKLYNRLEELSVIGLGFYKLHRPIARLLYYSYACRNLREHWETRINDVMSCPDNGHIPRAAHAGRVKDGYLIMHNGIKIVPGSYYGEGVRLMLERNGGVHEPQEEYAFMKVLEHIPNGAAMIELGAYWGFYSMWFHKVVRTPICILVEPLINNLRNGRKNFKINGMEGRFIRANVGATSKNGKFGVPVLAVDDIVREQGIERVHILHADIQGFELDMLKGAGKTLDAGLIDYVFISSHSNRLHADCISFLKDRGFLILADADLDETYSCDGVIVARRRNAEGRGPISISKREKR